MSLTRTKFKINDDDLYKEVHFCGHFIDCLLEEMDFIILNGMERIKRYYLKKLLKDL